MDPVVEDRLVKRSHVSPRETVRCSMALPGPSHFGLAMSGSTKTTIGKISDLRDAIQNTIFRCVSISRTYLSQLVTDTFRSSLCRCLWMDPIYRSYVKIEHVMLYIFRKYYYIFFRKMPTYYHWCLFCQYLFGIYSVKIISTEKWCLEWRNHSMKVLEGDWVD